MPVLCTSSASRVLRSACAALLVLGSLCSCTDAGSARIRSVAVEEAAAEILSRDGQVRLVLLYAASCPYSRELFPEFVHLAERARRLNVSIFAFSTDRSVETLEAYVGNQALPFSIVWIRPWKSGHLDLAMRPTGIDIGTTFGTPLIAVLDTSGQLVGQWEGEEGVEQAEQWLDSLGLRIGSE